MRRPGGLPRFLSLMPLLTLVDGSRCSFSPQKKWTQCGQMKGKSHTRWQKQATSPACGQRLAQLLPSRDGYALSLLPFCYISTKQGPPHPCSQSLPPVVKSIIMMTLGSPPTTIIAMQPPFTSFRLRREARTVEAMIHRYCRAHHQPPHLCPDCTELLAYARKRLHHCPFQEKKPTCGNCLIHCYTPQQRQRIQAVMRYAGPRMLFSHPILALWHLLDGLRKPRQRP